MNKLKQPNNSFKGLKIHCTTCRRYNPTCNHFDKHQYKVLIHIPKTRNDNKVKTLETRDLNEAIIEAAQYKQYLISTNYERDVAAVQSVTKIYQISPQTTSEPHSFISLTEAIKLYQAHLNGEDTLKHLKKDVSKEHVKETIRFCNKFR